MKFGVFVFCGVALFAANISAETTETMQLAALASAANCEITQYDGIEPGGAKQSRGLVIYECGEKIELALVSGDFPVTSLANGRKYKLLDQKNYNKEAATKVDLAAGTCAKDLSPLGGVYALRTMSSSARQFTQGAGLLEVVRVSHDRTRLESMPLAGISCENDEP